jgi:enoyl-CoA hydratase/carnithine racemase
MPTEIRFETNADMAWAILDRPKALNALSLPMIDLLACWLVAAGTDNNNTALGIRAAGGSAFSAGGDVRALFAAHGQGDQRALHHFYWHEYRLNRAIRRCPKPYVAVIDGLVMGGGAGISINGSHRVAGPGARFAMPETGIGFFPDVGASWFLSRCPGQIGLYLGLTGASLGPADMLFAGLATHYLPPGSIFANFGDIADLPTSAGPAPLAELRPAIDRCFAGDSVEAVMSALETEGSEWARNTAAALRQKSPTALKVTFRQLRQGAALDFESAMMIEYRLARHFMAGHDFVEGVRAAVIDKDRRPAWRPASLAEVDVNIVDSYFARAAGPDLDFD